MLSIRAWKRSVDILVASAVMALIAACFLRLSSVALLCF